MSKFFHGSSDSSDSDSEPEVAVRAPATRQAEVPLFSDSEDDAPRRVVRAAKDKVYDTLKENIKLSRNAEKIKDFTTLLTKYEALVKDYAKAKTVMNREGLTVPRFYIRYLVELEDFLTAQYEDQKAGRGVNMNKTNTKSFNALRQKLRKYNKEFEEEITAYRADADEVGYMTPDDAEAEVEAPAPQPVPTAPSGGRPVMRSSSSSESEGEGAESWDSDTDESSASSIDSDIESLQVEQLRALFLKKDPQERERKSRKRKEQKRPKQEQLEGDSGDEGWEQVPVVGEKPLFPPKAEITLELFIEKFNEITVNRGRKSTNTKTYLKYLQELYNIAEEKEFGGGILVKIRLTIIAALFEMDTKLSQSMAYESWKTTRETVDNVVDLLNKYPDVAVSVDVLDDQENFHDTTKPIRIHASIVLLVKRLDDELTKIFQHADCHSTDYLEKLKGERELCDLIEKTQLYVEKRQKDNIFDPSEIATICVVRIEHIYYKYAADEDATNALMDHLCNTVYALPNMMQFRQRAMLCHIYHHALHDRWQKAKDLMLMSHLQAIVDHSDAATQILYNRVICQLGLCAFRHGFIREAHQGLSEIQNTQRTKELLAQGVPPRSADKSSEQEAKEKSMQVPYHMHINLELLECVYLVSSMLLEIPNIACQEFEIKRRLLSRSFHFQLKLSEKSPLIGPPELPREHVVAASRAMLRGDWRKCRDYIINDKMNAKVWNLFRNTDAVKEMVVSRIQEEALRTYLLMYSTVYLTVSLSNLCETFELSKQHVYSIISKMIIQEELRATLDEPTNCLIMHRVEPSRLQIAALSLTDKLAILTENNEQIIEPRGTGRGYAGAGNWYVTRRGGDDRQGQDDKNRQRGYQGDRRGGNQDHRFNQDGTKRQWNPNAQNRRRDQKVRFTNNN